jgi:hypothetical protein
VAAAGAVEADAVAGPARLEVALPPAQAPSVASRAASARPVVTREAVIMRTRFPAPRVTADLASADADKQDACLMVDRVLIAAGRRTVDVSACGALAERQAVVSRCGMHAPMNHE